MTEYKELPMGVQQLLSGVDAGALVEALVIAANELHDDYCDCPNGARDMWEPYNGECGECDVCEHYESDGVGCRILWLLEKAELELRNRQQPMAEPPKEQFKVGDWVLIEVAGVESQQLISKGVFPDSINAGGIEFYSDGTPVMQPLNAKIIRKLDPSEVRVTITLEGTVHKIDGNNLAFELEDEKGAVTCVGYQQLDPDTEKLVRELTGTKGDES